MKIIFDRAKVASVISPLMATAVNRSTLPAVEGILIEAKFPNTVILTTYDLEKGMRTSIEAQVVEEGYFVVNAQKFNQTLYVMDSDKITLTVDDRMRATITSGRSTVSMNALDGEDFPAVPSLKSEMGFFIHQKVLRRMLAKTTYAMGTVDQRQVLNGCFVHVEDDSIMIVACDSFKLAKCTRKADIKKGNESDRYISYSFILPVKTVNELYRLLSDDEDAITRIYLMRKHIVFEIGNIVFFSRLIEGEYIDYDRIILNSHKIHVEANKDILLSALERAALITEEKIAGSVRSHVKLNVKDDIIEISAVSTNGSSYDEVKIDHNGDNLLIAFNNRYLMDSIRSCDTEKIKLSISSPLTSMNIEPVGEDDGIEEIYMLLPVRMKE
ncbi:MAG: DNA polymerase III subunit beta [Ruminococcaceae bacterium]|nr:DNA polymerase III subunit beta [Oscillospiraceae bacterium]